MKKVVVNVDWLPNNYSAAPANEEIACVVAAKTLPKLQEEMEIALREHIEWMRKDGDLIPKEFEGEWVIEWQFSARAQLKYAGNYITRKALARETGIAEQQLSHYANGQRHPRPAMQTRIVSGIRSIAERLAVIL